MTPFDPASNGAISKLMSEFLKLYKKRNRNNSIDVFNLRKWWKKAKDFYFVMSWLKVQKIQNFVGHPKVEKKSGKRLNMRILIGRFSSN